MPAPVNTQMPTTIAYKPEQEPIEASVSNAVQAESVETEIKPSIPSEIKIPQELEHVMQKSPDAEAPFSARLANQTGITLAKESTPVITTPSGTIRLPMTYSQAFQKEMHTSTTDSMHWLAAMIMYQWSKYEPDAVNDIKHKKTASQ